MIIYKMICARVWLVIIVVLIIILVILSVLVCRGSSKENVMIRPGGGKKRLRLFNLDLHISVIEDVKTHLQRYFGDEFDLVEWCISGHNHIMGKERSNPRYINNSEWRNIDRDRIGKFVMENREFLSSFDGFIVTHSPVFALIYQSFGKPIYVVNSCRFDQPFGGGNLGMREYLVGELRRMSDEGMLRVVSNNKGDRDYFGEQTGIITEHIPSLCKYTGVRYVGNREEFLYCGGIDIGMPNVVSKSTLPAGYEWSLICEFRGVIHVPYEISTMSIFEQYTSCIPLIVPSKRFLKELGTLITVDVYDVLSSSKYANIDEWIERADFYDEGNMPYVSYFDSWDELRELLGYIDTREITRLMSDWNIERTRSIESSMDRSFDIFKE